MDLFLNPPKSQWDALCQRPLQDDPVVRSRVESILSRVRNEGDAALEALSREIDGRAVALEVTPEQSTITMLRSM